MERLHKRLITIILIELIVIFGIGSVCLLAEIAWLVMGAIQAWQACA